jgi:hypothetical protein
MLQKKLTNRITIDEIYEHPWITGNPKQSKRGLRKFFFEKNDLIVVEEEGEDMTAMAADKKKRFKKQKSFSQ